MAAVFDEPSDPVEQGVPFSQQLPFACRQSLRLRDAAVEILIDKGEGSVDEVAVSSQQFSVVPLDEFAP
jgi:hypothetical protein